jgi:hypothetical protein
MYTTLKPRTNMALVFVSAGVAVTALLFTRPVPVTPALIGALLGGLAGVLQSRSMRAAPSTFQQAQTAMDVRRALTSTVPGKRAIQVQWVGAFILLGAGLWIGNPLGGWVTGYALLMCARDLVALRAVGQLAHSGVP